MTIDSAPYSELNLNNLDELRMRPHKIVLGVGGTVGGGRGQAL